MQIIKASAEILAATPDLEQIIEIAGRTCYRSEDKITAESATKFIQMLKERHHMAMLEHGAITVRFICDRGVSHEIVRHRIASYGQESTRYCNYSKDKFGNEITVIDIKEGFPEMSVASYAAWKSAMKAAEIAYFLMLDAGSTAQEARSVLPNSLKTAIAMTANPREWMHFFSLRTDKAAHPQMREVAIPLFEEFKKRWPAIFDSINQN